LTYQLVIGGPLSPARKGPQIKEMEELVALMPVAKMLNVFDDKDDLNKQLLFRKLGNVESANETRWTTPDGNWPVTVIDACPS
jgi:hypothetical protein